MGQPGKASNRINRKIGCSIIPRYVKAREEGGTGCLAVNLVTVFFFLELLLLIEIFLNN
jgi:hypothetical protein